ncbi:hypothetical protein [Paenibacillus massiliensis]|uniref:hypothetical protein n=1 Tax=Paenibacillus massiliensis TaxID=225917 RepID=UPI000361BD30|nr:hypothetical protein [Paenibacillus massiliensis]
MRRKAIAGWIRVVVVMVVLLGGAAPELSAQQYEYDSLNRLVSVEQEKKSVQYTYDAGGNLLTVKATLRDAGAAPVKGQVAEGWKSYATRGVEASFSTVTEDAYMASSGGTSTVTGDVYTITDDVYQQPVPEGQERVIQYIDVSSPQIGGANMYRDMAVTAGESYTVRGQAKVMQLDKAAVKVVVNYYDAAGKLLSYQHVAIYQQTNADWETFQAGLSVPAGAVKARVHLQITVLQPQGSGQAGFVGLSFAPAAAL